jgi:hypothetical protein
MPAQSRVSTAFRETNPPPCSASTMAPLSVAVSPAGIDWKTQPFQIVTPVLHAMRTPRVTLIGTPRARL